MTQPTNPGDVITRAAQRLTQQREATRALAQEIEAQRQSATGPEQAPAPEATP